nr:restriction endonuclease [uncultured Draconibacterium sp.]
MNDGKKIEKLVRLIQETLKNIPNTEIFSNFKIENNSGRKREIDILIKSCINNMDIKIAIECKNYKKPIPVEKIEAFNSKCMRIKGISKKVFVSSSGYQADSYEAAKDFEIELFSLDEISEKEISEWFPIKKLRANIKLQLPFNIQIQATEEEIKKIPNEQLTIHFYEKDNPILISGFVWNSVVVPEQNTIQSYMLLDFMKGNCINEKDKQTRIPFSLNGKGIYIIGEGNKKLNILKIESEIVCWYDEVFAHVIGAKNYKKVDSTTEASVVSLDVGKDEIADIVLTNQNDISIFHTTKDGQVYQMRTLASYDPKTDKLKIINEEKNAQ